MSPTSWALVIALAALIPLGDIVRGMMKEARLAATTIDIDRLEAGYGDAHPVPCVADGWTPRHRAPRRRLRRAQPAAPAPAEATHLVAVYRPPLRAKVVGLGEVRDRFARANPYAVHRDGWRRRPGVDQLIAMWAPPVAPVIEISRPALTLVRGAA